MASIHLQPDERPEDLSQRLMAFFEDNLLSVHGGLTHHGDQVTADEDLSPTLENTVVVLWLQLIHPGLPLLVKQKYGSELRKKTLSSLKPEISQALGSLLDELRSIEDTNAVPHHGATLMLVKANLDDAPSCPAPSAKQLVTHITLTT